MRYKPKTVFTFPVQLEVNPNLVINDSVITKFGGFSPLISETHYPCGGRKNRAYYHLLDFSAFPHYSDVFAWLKGNGLRAAGLRELIFLSTLGDRSLDTAISDAYPKGVVALDIAEILDHGKVVPVVFMPSTQPVIRKIFLEVVSQSTKRHPVVVAMDL